MRAHASQASAEAGADRTLAAFLRIPRPLYDLVFGREWFVPFASSVLLSLLAMLIMKFV